MIKHLAKPLCSSVKLELHLPDILLILIISGIIICCCIQFFKGWLLNSPPILLGQRLSGLFFHLQFSVFVQEAVNFALKFSFLLKLLLQRNAQELYSSILSCLFQLFIKLVQFILENIHIGVLVVALWVDRGQLAI